METKTIKASSYHPNRRKYNWLLYDTNDKWLDEFSKYYKGTLVDLGCGEMPYKQYFLQYCDKYIGVDWSNTLHELKADIISNLNEKIDISDNFADTIICLSVLEHLYNPQNLLNEAYRILNRGGGNGA